MPTLTRQTSTMTSKSEDADTCLDELSTNFKKPPIKRNITRVPGKEELRGKNPQMKMIGPEAEDAIQRKNYIHLSTRFELLKRGYMIKAEPRPEATFNVRMFSKQDPEYMRWKQANTPNKSKIDMYGKLIKTVRGPKATKYDLALDLQHPPKTYPDGTPRPMSSYVKEDLPEYEYFLVPRKCKKGVVQYFRPQQKIPFSHQVPEPRRDVPVEKVQESIKTLNKPIAAKNVSVVAAGNKNGQSRPRSNQNQQNNKRRSTQQPLQEKNKDQVPSAEREPREKGWSQKARREQKMKLEEYIWPRPQGVSRNRKSGDVVVEDITSKPVAPVDAVEENKENGIIATETEVKC